MYNGLPEILCNNRGLRNQLEIMGGKPSKCTVEGADPVNFKIASDDKYQRHVNQSLHQELNQARKNPQGADKLTPPLAPRTQPQPPTPVVLYLPLEHIKLKCPSDFPPPPPPAHRSTNIVNVYSCTTGDVVHLVQN